MHVFRAVLSWSHRTITAAADKGSGLVAHLAAGSCNKDRPAEQGHVEVVNPAVSHDGPQQPNDTSPDTDTARVGTPATTRRSPRQHPVRRRPPTAPVTPAMVRRWAHEQGIQVADRGRIPRSVMERYMADAVQTA